ncbi:MAG: type II secretion system F family protein [Kiritimatiellae bacterium]|nr:type II secretion system F family protein [Kiritimatiellia bacterium]
MPKFKYVAMDSSGSEKEGIVEAASQTQAIAKIRSQDMFPTRVVEVGGGAKKAEKAAKSGMNMEIKLPSFMAKKVKAKELMVFTRQLATLVDAGLPLLRGLKILLKQEKHPALREALTGMGEAVEGGSTFSESLAQYPVIFDNLFVNMVRAGEAGGVLDVVLARLSEFMEKAEKIKNKVKSAMVYPVVVLVAAFGILAFMLTSVIPKFEAIFNDLLEGQQLPGITRFVIGLSNFVQSNGIVIVIGIAVFVFLYKMWVRTERGRFIMDKVGLNAPVFGNLMTKTAVSRFARTLGTLMSSGVPILQALNIVRDTSGNTVIAKAIQQVHDSVKEGDSMAMPLEAAKVFPGMVVSMVDVGEETGALPEMLTRIADNYDDEVDSAVEGMTSAIEPIMIVMLAVIIGTIVIAMFLPLIKIMGSVG